MTTETEAERGWGGGGGGTLDFWKDWPQLPDDFIVPGKLYTSGGEAVYLVNISSSENNVLRMKWGHFCDLTLWQEEERDIFFALSELQTCLSSETKEKCKVFKALHKENVVYVLVDTDFNADHMFKDEVRSLRKDLNTSIVPLDEVKLEARLSELKGNESHEDQLE